MTSHEQVRLERMNTIRASVAEAKATKKELDVDKLINVCCVEWGCARRTVLEYMKVLGI